MPAEVPTLETGSDSQLCRHTHPVLQGEARSIGVARAVRICLSLGWRRKRWCLMSCSSNRWPNSLAEVFRSLVGSHRLGYSHFGILRPTRGPRRARMRSPYARLCLQICVWRYGPRSLTYVDVCWHSLAILVITMLASAGEPSYKSSLLGLPGHLEQIYSTPARRSASSCSSCYVASMSDMQLSCCVAPHASWLPVASIRADIVLSGFGSLVEGRWHVCTSRRSGDGLSRPLAHRFAAGTVPMIASCVPWVPSTVGRACLCSLKPWQRRPLQVLVGPAPGRYGHSNR